MKRFICALSLLSLTAACEPEEQPNILVPKVEETPPVEKVVTTEIPSDLQAQAATEVTAENVDSVAAELEKEIEADTQ